MSEQPYWVCANHCTMEDWQNLNMKIFLGSLNKNIDGIDEKCVSICHDIAEYSLKNNFALSDCIKTICKKWGMDCQQFVSEIEKIPLDFD